MMEERVKPAVEELYFEAKRRQMKYVFLLLSERFYFVM